MCKIGDLILIDNPSVNGNDIGRHPFLVLDDEGGIVRGTYDFDFIGLLLSSNETELKRQKMLKYETNFPITKDDKVISDLNYTNLNSFIEVSPLYYFSKSEISFKRVGRIEEDIFNLIMEYIEELSKKGTEFKVVLDKAKKI